MKNKIAIIAARGGSKRLPGKNIMEFLGKPMIAWPIKAAQESGLFERIIVSSDCREILDIAMQYGAEPWRRDDELAKDHIDVHTCWYEVLDGMGPTPDYVCGIYPTAVFLKPVEIVTSYSHLLLAEADACIGVSKFEYHPYQWLEQKPSGYIGLKYPQENELPRYPEAFASNGTLQWFKVKSFLDEPTPFPPKLIGYQTESVDINSYEDYRRAVDKAKNKI